MQSVPSACPFCRGDLTVTRLYCPACETAIEGRFEGGAFGGLTPEQVAFVESFVRCEGKFTRLEGELGMSYPTLRSRLHDVIRAMGYEPGVEETPVAREEDRRRVLTDLEEGRISPDQAVELLKGGSQ
jgi:hypothetical protein